MRMPFGQYRGEEVEDLPTDYLEWLYENVELYGELEETVIDILRARETQIGY